MAKPVSRGQSGSAAAKSQTPAAQKATAASKKSSARPIVTGQRYYVQWRTGEPHAAEIVETRPVKRAAGDSSASKDSKGEAAQRLEYYVHYISYDRRLDEWVTADRVDAITPIVVVNGDGLELNGGEEGRGAQRKNKKKAAGRAAADDHPKEGGSMSLEKEHEEITKVKNIQFIELGQFEIETWYFSPYPEEYCGEEKLFVCEFCLKYMKHRSTLTRHCEKCNARSPPGREIYNGEGLAMFEIDGKDSRIYCQNLCLLSKLFLDHKTLYYDVDPFMFYVLCEIDSAGFHIVGYFSKEKDSQENYNLACILTFPPYQRKGYGKFLISVSYELTKREGTTGSPEKPLSDLGKISYRSYWAYIIMCYLSENLPQVSIQQIASATGIKIEDILSTMHSLNAIKYWKGQHVIAITQPIIDSYLQQAKRLRLCNPDYLTWQPPSDKGPKKQAV